jgi:hypothetical protein
MPGSFFSADLFSRNDGTEREKVLKRENFNINNPGVEQ